MQRAKCATCLTLLVVLTALAACAREVELAFETIEQDDSHSAAEGLGSAESHAIIIAARDEIPELRGLVSQRALDQVENTDFQEYFVVALFRGRRATGGYSTIIQRVTKKEDTIVIYAQFWEPAPYYEVINAATAPYHLIKVNRYDGVDPQTKLVVHSEVVTPTPPSR
jgi:hypothetical protein